MALQILATPTFTRFVKKMNTRDKAVLDLAIQTIADNPKLGELKKGDLGMVQVHKFKLNSQEFLLAYSLTPNRQAPTTLVLLSVGSHENFYADLKRLPGV